MQTTLNHERQIIACLVFDDSTEWAQAACVENKIGAHNFSDKFCRTTFELCKGMIDAKIPVSLYGVCEAARSSKIQFDVGELSRIINDSAVKIPYLKYSIDAVKLAHFGRQAEDIIKQTLMKLQDDEPVTAIHALQVAITELQADQLPRTNTIHSIGDFREMKVAQWRAAKGSGFTGIPSSLKPVNQFLGGYRRRVMTIIGGYRGEGKSTLMRQELFGMAKLGYKTLLITLEDPMEVCDAAIAGNDADVSIYTLDTGTASQWQIDKIESAWASLAAVPMKIATGRTIDDCLSLISVCRARYGLDAVGIDHVQHIAPYVIKGLDRNGTVGSYSGSLCHSFIENDIAGLVASQFSRDGEKMGRKPRLSDLRDSGCLEQDARAALLLSKDGEFHNLEVAKNSYGPSGNDIKIRRNGGAQRFELIENAAGGNDYD
jgi:replicative DNA helicase